MSKKASVWALALNILLILTLIPLVSFDSARAQDASAGGSSGGGAGEISPTSQEAVESLAEPPALTAEQQAQLAFWAENTSLPGPVLAGAGSESTVAEALDPGTATSVERVNALSPRAPLAPGTAQIYRKTSPNSVIPAGFKSNVMESSVGQGGKWVFYTGNWFAARSGNGGGAWTYVNPFSGMADFCCDQVTIFDESRGTIYWLRMGSPTNSQNRFILGSSQDGGVTFCNYNFPTLFAGTWWDYPHIQLGADYMYLTWNMFAGQPPNSTFNRSIVLRLPLSPMAGCAGFNYEFYWNSGWSTFVPVQGADHTMYWASNWPGSLPQNSRLAIWTWNEDQPWTSITAVVKNVAAWTFTNRGQALCGSTSGNWAARTDQRVLTGARYMIQATNLKWRGRQVLGWWWNVQEGGAFARPYTEAAAFFEDTLAQVPGNQGRPLVWNPSTCYLYPSVAANQRGDLGMVINYGPPTAYRPYVAFGLADDFVGAPPGWSLTFVQASNARPSSNNWGDYNTSRAFQPTQDTWTGAAHYIPGTINCSNCSVPVFFNFGRGRDYRSWSRWYNR